ncbi:MAG: alpha/beta hydrolase, partial [Limnobacter sp.]|nr:alpha/beta hydrolase [Limnobacter sp.]
DSWLLYSDKAQPDTAPYGHKLESGFEVSALHLRYNTGLSVQSNGRRLARLLNKVAEHWPVPVARILLVGHSMGGLVSRIAVESLGETQQLASPLVKEVVCLGTPHTGAPLARLAGKGEELFSRFELSKPLGKVLGVRSTGVRDLQTGLGSLQTADGREVGFHLLGATVGKSTGSRLNESLGDGLVQMSSALADESGQAQRLAFAEMHHMMLLNHPEIYRQLEAVVRLHIKPKQLIQE